MKRSGFLGALASMTLAPLAARATGGLDDFGPAPSNQRTVRVLLGRGMAQVIDPQSFSFGTRRYRGTFSTLPTGEVVNTVDLQSYLYSVVPMESPHSWPQETLRAQAILARTFAIRRLNSNRPYDLVASESDQAYGGLGAEFAESTTAVDETAGTVLQFGGALASISYGSCCGGHTESAADAWLGGSAAPYLRGVPCTYCSGSPDYQWTRSIPITSAQNAINGKSQIGALQSINIAQTDASGRAKQLHISGTQGELELSGADFRRLLGPYEVRSLLLHRVDVAQAEGTVTIEGSGRGHGVGLCQWGARALGAAGHSALDILTFYFPGTELARDGT